MSRYDGLRPRPTRDLDHGLRVLIDTALDTFDGTVEAQNSALKFDDALDISRGRVLQRFEASGLVRHPMIAQVVPTFQQPSHLWAQRLVAYTVWGSMTDKQRQGLGMKGWTGAVLSVGVIVAIALMTKIDKLPPAADANSEKASWIAEHGSDPEALSKRFQLEGDVACARHADDYLRGRSRYDFGWDLESEGKLRTKFATFSTQSMGPGLLTLVSENAKLSNAFGAFGHLKLFCLFNVATGEVVRYATHDPANEKDVPHAVDRQDTRTKLPSATVIHAPEDQSVTNPASPEPAGETTPIPTGLSAIK